MTFNINASIEHQFAGSMKVLKILDSGLDITYPIVAWLKGSSGGLNYGRNGKLYCDGSDSHLDLITKTPPLETFLNVYPDKIGATASRNLSEAERVQQNHVIRVIKISVNLDTGQVTGEIVWRKEKNEKV